MEGVPQRDPSRTDAHNSKKRAPCPMADYALACPSCRDVTGIRTIWKGPKPPTHSPFEHVEAPLFCMTCGVGKWPKNWRTWVRVDA